MNHLFDLAEINQILTNCLIDFVGISIKGSIGILIVFLLYRLKKHSSSQMHKLLLITIFGMIFIPIFFYLMPIKDPITFTVEPYSSYSYIISQKLPITDDNTDVKYNSYFESAMTKSDMSVFYFLPTIWLIGVVYCALRLVTGIYGLQKIIKNCDYIIVYHNDESNVIHRIKKQLKIKRPVHAIVSSNIASPVTFGIFEPLIILPKQCFQWTDERWEIVLTHEMYHIKKYDSFINLIIQATCAVFWFNPLICTTGRMIREERENACDDFVLRSGIKPHIYAIHLVEMIRMSSATRMINMITTGINNLSGVEKRIIKIMDSKKKEVHNKSIVWIGFLIILILTSMYTVEVVFANERNETEKFDVILNNERVTINDSDNNMYIIDALPQDIPSLSPLGENGKGEALNYYSKTDKWSWINSSTEKYDNVPIYASADGKIEVVGSVTSYSGQTNITIVIQHKNNLSSIYGCISETDIKEGDFVKKGDIIGHINNGQICYKINYGMKNIAPSYFLKIDKLISKR